MSPPQTDCRHYQGDRPCAPHKAEGVACEASCPHYDPAGTRLLLVKLAAMGDVLRTTSLLPAIHARWPGAHLTWVTAPNAVPLLKANPLVDRVLTYSGALPLALATERFDAVLNPDADPEAAALAHAARTELRVGFGFDERGASVPLSPGAESWHAMGLDDALKKANRRSYQSHMCDVLEIENRRDPPQLVLPERVLAASRARREQLARPGASLVGLNTGAGGRWRFKRWTEDGYVELIERLHAAGHRVLLLGGPEERERNARLVAASKGRAVDTGCDNSIEDFAGIVQSCDALVVGDTLAMHIAIARRVPVVVLFGPTSLHEIDVFERGERLAPELDCLVCYLMDCDKQPNCMESLSVDQVEAAVLRQLDAAPQTLADPERAR